MFHLDNVTEKVDTNSIANSSSLNSLDLLKNDTSFSTKNSIIDKVDGNTSKLDVGNIWGDLAPPSSADFLGLPSPGDLFRSLPSPGDLFRHLPSPGDTFRSLPSPEDIFQKLPSPGDLLDDLPKPELPDPPDVFHILPKLPDPGDLFDRLPTPPDPLDVIKDFRPPSPSEILDPLHIFHGGNHDKKGHHGPRDPVGRLLGGLFDSIF